MAAPAISVEHVGKTYWSHAKPTDRAADALARLTGKRAGAPFEALHDVSFEVPHGDAIGLIGRNGAGKSTLLQIIAGTVRPTTGRVTADGRLSAMIELGAGFNPEFTGRENIALAGALAGLSAKQVRTRLPDILDFAGIGDFVDQPVKTYSSGMYARLAFAISAHVDADILLVDEILSVGDVSFQRKCANFIDHFRQRGTVIFTSHSMRAVQAICSRAIWIDHGRVRLDGDAEGVCARYLAETTAAQPAIRAAEDEPVWRAHVRTAKPDAADDVVEIMPFDTDAAWFGKGGGHIDAIGFFNRDGERLERTHGGELVELRIDCSADAEIARALVGFRFCDEMGQVVFGQNTHATYEQMPFAAPAGTRFRARFRFTMPRLRAGLYAMTAALTEGTQSDNVHHHFITDVLFIRVSQSQVFRGIVGCELRSVEIRASHLPAETVHGG